MNLLTHIYLYNVVPAKFDMRQDNASWDISSSYLLLLCILDISRPCHQASLSTLQQTRNKFPTTYSHCSKKPSNGLILSMKMIKVQKGRWLNLLSTYVYRPIIAAKWNTTAVTWFLVINWILQLTTQCNKNIKPHLLQLHTILRINM